MHALNLPYHPFYPNFSPQTTHNLHTHTQSSTHTNTHTTKNIESKHPQVVTPVTNRLMFIQSCPFKVDDVAKGEDIFPSNLKEHPSVSYYLALNWIMVSRWMFFEASWNYEGGWWLVIMFWNTPPDQQPSAGAHNDVKGIIMLSAAYSVSSPKLE